MRHFLKTYFIALLPALLLAGCASAPLVAPSGRAPSVPGIYHRIERGQTLWSIAKIYNLDLEELVNVNHISDVSNLEVGQLIFIPNRRQQQSSYSNFGGEDFIWPLRGRVISGYGQNHNILNKGINIQSRSGSEVVASRGGRVVFRSLDFADYGKTIIIDHGDGFSTVYAGEAVPVVNLGEQVQKGQVIARFGSSSYLHFEIRKGYMSQNPYYYLS
jgi:murein DD-endopeptidase MepM/ murein hydrolase activator NlpD